MIPAPVVVAKNTKNAMAPKLKISQILSHSLTEIFTILILITSLYGALSNDRNSDSASYARLYMGNATALPGDTLTVQVILPNADSIAGFQFDLLPASPGIDIISIGSGERIESLHGWNVYSNRLYDGIYKIIGFDLEGVGIGAGNGAIVNLEMVMPNDISHGIFRIDFSDQILSDNLGNIVPSNVEPGYVSITDKDVVFTCLPDTLSNRDVSKNISILMSNSADVTGFQFDLVDSADIFQVSDVYNPFGSEWDVQFNELGNGAVRILCSNFSGELIPQNSVNNLVLTVKADSNALSGTYPIYFENMVVSDKNAQAISVEGIGSTILFDNILLTLFDLLDRTGPEDFSLSQNYPNPFNSITRIDYALPEATPVRIVIYNLLGQSVKTILSEVQQPGFYFYYWDGRDQRGNPVESGIYFNSIQAGDFIKTVKMVHLK